MKSSCLLRKKVIRASLPSRFFSLSLEANSSEEVFDKLRSRIRSLSSDCEKVCRLSIWCSILLFCISSLVFSGGLVVAVGKLCERWYRKFFAVSHWTAGRWKVGVLEAVPILPVDASSIDSAEVTIRCMVKRLPPNHRNPKLQGSFLAIRPPPEVFHARLAHRVRCPRLILITQLDFKVSLVGALHKSCDILQEKYD